MRLDNSLWLNDTDHDAHTGIRYHVYNANTDLHNYGRVESK